MYCSPIWRPQLVKDGKSPETCNKIHVNSSQLTSLCHDSVSLFISFNKNILTTFQPVTLAFIRFEVIHKFKNQNNKQSQCACAGMRTCVDGG